MMDQTPPPALPATTQRHDGWTPERQRGFCEALADLGSVAQAARAVGMALSGAYALRRRPEAAAFALAWDAALLLARKRLVDEAYQLAFDGSHDLVIQDGVVVAERRKRDSRAILSSLERLQKCDQMVDPAAHIVARDFDAFLGTIDGTGRPDATRAFIDARSGKRPSPARDKFGQFLPKAGQ